MDSFSKKELEQAVALLREGRVIGLPTETVYGLAGDAFNSKALAAIFEIKQRPLFDPLILHFARLGQIEDLCTAFPPRAKKLADLFWPGPLTLVLPRNRKVPDLATAGLETVAVRMPAHPVAKLLLQEFGGPLAAPSANRFGRISPTTAEAVKKELGDAVPLVLDGGPCAVGIESTIVSFADESPQILRLGGISVEAIEEAIGKVELSSSVEKNPTAPGQLKHHYAPQKKLSLVASLNEITEEKRINGGVLLFGAIPSSLEKSFAKVCQLSAEKNLVEAATQFFAMLRELDESNVTELFAVRLPETGLGRAINERLERAAH